jgi:microcystin-dependent protein
VFNGSGFYRCLVAHTSGTFATDLAAAKWQLIVNLAAVALVNASQIAVTASGSLTTDVQGSLQALDSGKAASSHTHPSSALSDSTAAGRALLTAADATAQNVLLGTTSLGFQSGDIKETAVIVLQSGWYYCDGSAKNRVTDVNLFNAITIQQSGVLNATAVVTGLSDTSKMSIGMPVSGTNIPAATYIQSVDSSTQVTLTAAATGSATTALVFAPFGVGDGTTTFNLPTRAGLLGIGPDNISGSAANNSQVSTTITTTASTTATVASATGLFIGMYVQSSKITFGTKITAISGTTITLSAAATGVSTAVAARFSPLTDAQTIGAVGGELGHVDVSTEMPAHTHVATSVVTDPGHVHTQGYVAGSYGAYGGTSINIYNPPASASTASQITGITVATTNASTGGGLAHNNMQKTIVMNYIIKK